MELLTLCPGPKPPVPQFALALVRLMMDRTWSPEACARARSRPMPAIGFLTSYSVSGDIERNSNCPSFGLSGNAAAVRKPHLSDRRPLRERVG
jgi:hypothetical protein